MQTTFNSSLAKNLSLFRSKSIYRSLCTQIETDKQFVYRLGAKSHRPNTFKKRESKYDEKFKGGDVLIAISNNWLNKYQQEYSSLNINDLQFEFQSGTMSNEYPHCYASIGFFHQPKMGPYDDMIVGTTAKHFFDVYTTNDLYDYYIYSHYCWQLDNGSYIPLAGDINSNPTECKIKKLNSTNKSDVVAFTSCDWHKSPDKIRFDEVEGIGKVNIEASDIKEGDVVCIQGTASEMSALRVFGINNNHIGFKNYFNEMDECLYEGDAGSLYINKHQQIIASHTSSVRRLIHFGFRAHFGSYVKDIQSALGYPQQFQTPPPTSSTNLPYINGICHKTNIKIPSNRIKAIPFWLLPDNANIVPIPPCSLPDYVYHQYPTMDVGYIKAIPYDVLDEGIQKDIKSESIFIPTGKLPRDVFICPLSLD